MSIDQATPCFVMFEAFKEFGSLSYKDLAGIILSDKPVYEGRSPRSRIDDKTWVSRYIVHAPIGSVQEWLFADFGTSARAVASYLKSLPGKNIDNQAIIGYFSGKAADAMKRALDGNGLDGTIYWNVLRRITSMEDASHADIVDLILLHFLATGATNDARKAADYTLEFAQNALRISFQTTLPSIVDIEDEPQEEEVYLCLCRIQDGKLKSSPYYLNPGEEGTEIGSFATKQYSITDVEETVSGRHLLIWRDQDGKWYAQGMESKNGTVLISGADRREVVVELPRKEAEGTERLPVEIKPGDELILARDTVFMVMQSVAY